MSKDAINVKSNGLRNELKEIRKSIDKLTNAILMAQTHKQHENNYYTNGKPVINGELWHTTSTIGQSDVEIQESNARGL